MTMTQGRRKFLVKLEQVLIPNLKVRLVSSDNPLPTGMRNTSRQIANQQGTWRISDEDNVFLLEESHSREDARFYDYNQEEVDKLRQDQEQKPQLDTWMEPCEVINVDDESSLDEDYE